jgi:Ni,Fe-hydrogenase III large subunit
MSDLIQFLRDQPIVSRHQPFVRVELSRAKWQALALRLREEPWELIGLWGEPGIVHAALRDPAPGMIAVVSLACDEGYPSLAAARPGAARLERATRDLFGLVAEGAEDQRPWLDHGRWGVRRPLAAQPEKRALDEPAARANDYPFLPVEGEGVHIIPVGPVHAGIIEPGHFRFHAQGETVARLEERLGYTHKGIDALANGRDLAEAARLAGRVSGDSTVAHAFAFARAVEAACQVEAPPRARLLRAVMAELERLANHLGDFGAICNDAAFAFIHAEATSLRELVLCTAAKVFGHRLMMDQIVPGGVAQDVAPIGTDAIRRLVGEVRARSEALARVYGHRASLLDRMTGTGVIKPDLAARFAAGGVVGRASGRAVDARRSPGYPPYTDIAFAVPVLEQGDVHARVLIRLLEIEESLKLVASFIERLQAGPIAVALNPRAGEGMALVEGFRGDVMAWVKLDARGRIARLFLRDPSWFHWPLLEAAIENNIVADFPLCNKSINGSYSGVDL